MNARNGGIGADLDLPASVTARSAQMASPADLPLIDGALIPAYPDGSEEDA